MVENYPIIIGAGPAGLSAGYYLTKHKHKVLLLESDQQVGGISKTVLYKKNRFDIGGHRFLTDSKIVYKYWLEIVGGGNFLKKKRLSRIYYEKKFFQYPLKIGDALIKLGLITDIVIILSFLKSKIWPKNNEENFENWVINRFGKKLYEIFFKSYTVKVLGIKPKKISADWGRKRIKGLSLIKAALGSLPVKIFKAPKTLTSFFYYPPLGPGQLWEKAAEKIRNNNGQIKLNEPVRKIQRNKGLITNIITHLKSYKVKEKVLSSMALIDLISCLKPAPPKIIIKTAKKLLYRDFLTVGLIVKKNNLIADNWLYIHDPKVKVGRIQFYANWSTKMVFQPKKYSLIGLEYFCQENDSLWKKSDQSLINLAIKESKTIGLIDKNDVVDGKVMRIKKAYPVYDLNYKKYVKIVRNWLEDNLANLILIGRNGMHRYNSQDQSTLVGIMAAKKVMGQKTKNLWEIDPDFY